MKITLDYRHPTPSHCDVAVFVNGALAGVLTLRQEEVDVFQDVIVRGLHMPGDSFKATGDPGDPASSRMFAKHFPQCPRCGGEMRPGKALQSTMTGVPDFPGGDVVTVSPGGPGRLVDCIKCSGCGFSVSAGAER